MTPTLTHTIGTERGSDEKIDQFEAPQSIGRYSVKKVIGHGGFGVVYLGYDEALEREIAIKIPRPDRIRGHDAIKAFLAEAQTLAQLDHAAIVPVYDVGATQDGCCYVVSKVIDGHDLEQELTSKRIPFKRCAQIVKTLSEALQYAHSQGLIHRDIKPANILIDESDRPFVTDFGLALREDDTRSEIGFAGTPAYMSPEQARGEGHLIDRRTDIYSLGMVMYQMLTNRLPFVRSSTTSILHAIQCGEMPRPRQFQSNIPAELEQICLKCLSKRVSDRYSNMQEMADALDCFLAEIDAIVVRENSDVRLPKVLPKGLQSYDQGDAEFFLDLLPGVRDADGLPEQIRFWKQWVETIEPEATRRAGIFYGGAGSGKSSFIKAGLLPQLSQNTTPICIEASAEQTEVKLRAKLLSICPETESSLLLPELFKAARLTNFQPLGQKTLVVIDQFERWLHSHEINLTQPLIQALRQCDGERIQCLLVVRDDTWSAAAKLMAEIDVPLIEQQNSKGIESFSLSHAEHILQRFGQAYNRLPQDAEDLAKDQSEFLQKAIRDLAVDDEITPLQISVFAHLMKSKPWTSRSLQRLGGTLGVGVAFLDETFVSSSAPKKYAQHEPAILRILEAIIPSTYGTQTRSLTKEQVGKVSGYEANSKNLNELLQILVDETRLISPVADVNHNSAPSLAETSYRLTQEHLGDAIQTWVDSKKESTCRGWAELQLAKRSNLWQTQRDKKYLPTWFEWCMIELWTGRFRWSESHRSMMKAARILYLRRLFAVVLGIVLIVFTARSVMGHFGARSTIAALMTAKDDQVAAYLEQLQKYKPWTSSQLQHYLQRGTQQERTIAHLALFVTNGTRGEELAVAALNASPKLFVVLRDKIGPTSPVLQSAANNVLTNQSPASNKASQPNRVYKSYIAQRRNALACLDADAPILRKNLDFIVEQILASILEQPSDFDAVLSMFQHTRNYLLDSLKNTCKTPANPEQSVLAATVAARIYQDDLAVLLEFLLQSQPNQVAVFLPYVEQFPKSLEALQQFLDKRQTTEITQLTNIRRQANAILALAHMGQSKWLWQGLRYNDDLTLRSHLIDRVSRTKLDPRMIAGRLKLETDGWVRRALLCGLGGYAREQLDPAVIDFIIYSYLDSLADNGSISGDSFKPSSTRIRNAIAQILNSISDTGERSAFEWMCRQWGFEKEILQANSRPVIDSQRSEQNWSTTSEGHVIGHFSAGVFTMGSPPNEEDRDQWEPQHLREINRRFGISLHEITNEQFERFHRDLFGSPRCETFRRSNHPQAPTTFVSWNDAALYCNWLSKRVGIPENQWCYIEVSSKDGTLLMDQDCFDSEDAPKRVMKSVPDILQRVGYRLPTEAEWEYVCRATTQTPRYFGRDLSLFSEYAWWARNSAPSLRKHPVGMKKPNDFGLFDMYGNAHEFCQDFFHLRYGSKGQTSLEEPISDTGGPSTGNHWTARGGAAGDPDPARSAFREAVFSTKDEQDRGYAFGFRIAKTIETSLRD